MSYTNSFNTIIEQFLEQLEICLPQEKNNIQTYRNSFNIIKKVNVNKPGEKFIENVLPYQEQLKNHDESFFKEYGHNIPILIDLHILDWWDTLTTTNKNTIWQYLDTLFQLGLKIIKC